MKVEECAGRGPSYACLSELVIIIVIATFAALNPGDDYGLKTREMRQKRRIYTEEESLKTLLSVRGTCGKLRTGGAGRLPSGHAIKDSSNDERKSSQVMWAVARTYQSNSALTATPVFR